MNRRAASPRRSATLLTIAGVVFALAGLALVVSRIIAQSDEVGDAVSAAEAGWLAPALLCAGAGMTAIAVPWRRALALMGGRLGWSDLLARYYLGEIGKYLPGGVWPVVGRGELAVRAGVDRPPAYGSVALSLGALYLGALLVATALFPVVLLMGGSSSSPVWLLVLVPLGLLVLHPAVLDRVLSLAGRVARRSVELEFPPWAQTVRLVVRYAPAWLLIGTATWSIARALDPSAPWIEVVFATVLAWTAGFVIAPVPGGVGVREAAFVTVATSLEPGIAAATALVARVVFMAVDAVGAVVGSVWLSARARSAGATARGRVGDAGGSRAASTPSRPGPAGEG